VTTRKSALVTGGAGFVGRHVCTELERRGWDVISVDVRPTDVVWFPPEGARTSRIHVISDLHDFLHNAGGVERSDIRYDLVVHCAYAVGGRAGIDGLNDNFVRNTRLDSTLFEWAIRTHQPHVLYWSSSAVYPSTYQSPDVALSLGFPVAPLKEDLQEPGDDRAPECESLYGWAKYVGELLAQTARVNGVKVTVVRPFSGYGTDQSLDYPFPAFIDRARRRVEPFHVWGSLTQVRDWVHIDDVVAGALAAVDAGVSGPLNICSGQGTAMGDLASMICQTAGYEPEIITVDAPKGVEYRVGDPTKFFDIYRPTVSLEESVDRALRGVL
jgi:nucleoside-diphosphate-sugar epimerase